MDQASLGSLGSILGRLGGILGPSGALLGAYRPYRRRLGTVLEAILAVLEGSFVDFEVVYGFSVAVEALFGLFCGPLGPSWDHLGGLLLFWKSLCVETL